MPETFQTCFINIIHGSISTSVFIKLNFPLKIFWIIDCRVFSEYISNVICHAECQQYMSEYNVNIHISTSP